MSQSSRRPNNVLVIVGCILILGLAAVRWSGDALFAMGTLFAMGKLLEAGGHTKASQVVYSSFVSAFGESEHHSEALVRMAGPELHGVGRLWLRLQNVRHPKYSLMGMKPLEIPIFR